MRLWFLVLFVLQLVLGATKGDDPTQAVDRTYRVASAVAQLAGVLAGYLFLFSREMFGGRVFRVQKAALWSFLVLSVWTGWALLSTVSGWWLHYQTTYVWGDAYKFLLLPLLFILAYFGIRNQQQLDTLLQGIVVVMGIALLVDFIRQYTWLTQYGGRFMTSSTYHIATLTPFVLYLLLTGKGSPLFRGVLWFVTLEIGLSIVLLQGLSDYVYAGLLMVIFLYFFRDKRLAVAAVLLGVIAFIGITDPLGLWGRGTYVGRKFDYAAATAEGSTLGVAERVTGSRLGEIIGILRAYSNSPARLPLGFGMGAFAEVLPITMAEIPETEFTPWWQPVQHFIHSGLFEVFYRTGLAGIVTLLAFFTHSYARGRRLVSGPHRNFGRFVMANSVYQLANAAIQTPISYVWLFLVIPLAGTYVLQRGTAPSECGSRSGRQSAAAE